MAQDNNQKDYTVSINNGSATEAEKELAQRVQAAMGQVFNELGQQRLANARESFRSLRNEFLSIAADKFNQQVERLDSSSREEDIAIAKKIYNARRSMALQSKFYRAALAIVPSESALTSFVLDKYDLFINRVADVTARLLKESCGERPASKMLPESFMTPDHAQVSAELGMKNLETLIRRSIAPL